MALSPDRFPFLPRFIVSSFSGPMDTCADFQVIFDTMAGIGCTEDSINQINFGFGPMTYGEICALFGFILSCTVGTFEHARRACSCALTRGPKAAAFHSFFLSIFLHSPWRCETLALLRPALTPTARTPMTFCQNRRTISIVQYWCPTIQARPLTRTRTCTQVIIMPQPLVFPC